MAKGFNARGMKGMGGGMNMNMNMIRQAQKMQADMQKMQSQLEDKIYTVLRQVDEDANQTVSKLTGGLNLGAFGL